ncbi:MAG: hypothetical protein PWP24_373 [Clostridiales bacterium]|nr:hypothetical protein [Clostridiales bacterium]
MMPINVIIVDDHSMIREGLKQLLELDGDIKVIGEAGDGIECLQLINTVSPDVLLLDINMPNANGLYVLEEMKKEKRNIKVLILTIHNEIEYLLKAVDLGVDGYVLKDSNSSLLKEAITAVYEGRTYIQPSLAPILRDKKNTIEKGKREANLTKRELQVIELLGEGLYNKEIAERLFISEKTVKNHVSSIFKKIGVTDRTQAVVYAIKNNIIDVL